ncbi:glycosyltransferase 87 family protein [Agromyces seonyuensis]|uniref:DUF2029 domain-containing protein n=1 Tax=Agromyces seonyuensis TaxID=2662446 RepID=A0A6I4NX18_9MICO|nr:glycosyltransferase 87 family protein [Agromyces seonyuensis]MWB98833.1 DUF2029 domain-containing protein [Agromyces seonyuensis]
MARAEPGGAPRDRRGIRWLDRRAALWIGFLAVHGLLIWLNLAAPGYPLGDVTGVYKFWATEATDGWMRIGIDAPWVYPILAFAPMTAALALGPELYGLTWLLLASGLNAVVFGILLGRGRLARTRRIAAWWWLVFLAALGPIALGRIDAITVPFAITGMLWALGRPRVAAVLFTIGAWIKVWPGALLLALAIVAPRRREVLGVAIGLSAGIVGVSLLAGSGLDVFGFIGEQTGRGLQVEAGLAVPFLWAIVGGSSDHSIYYDRQILTFQVNGPGTEFAAALATPLMLVGVAAVSVLGVLAVRRGGSAGRILVPLSLGLVTALMLGNKVGSPQFVTWLAAPIVLGLLLRPRRLALPASVAVGIAVLTHLLYPYLYGWLLIADPAFVLLLTLKIVGLLVLYAWSIVELVRAGRRRLAGPPAGRPAESRPLTLEE